MTQPLAVVGLVEIADMLKVERTTVRTWYHRGKLPTPDALLAATPVWRVSTIRRHFLLTSDTICDKVRT